MAQGGSDHRSPRTEARAGVASHEGEESARWEGRKMEADLVS